MNKNILLGLVLVIGITATVYLLGSSSDDIDSNSLETQVTQESNTANQNTQQEVNTETRIESEENSDGVYKSEIEYDVPQRHVESIEVEITIEDGIVTELKNTHSKTSEDSVYHQNDFENAITDQVIGKKIEEIELSRVGGASLTTGAFNQALDEIMEQI